VWVLARLRGRGSGVMRETYNFVNRGKQGKRERNKKLHLFFYWIISSGEMFLRLCKA
jgi:hypothetical protein